MDSQVQEIKDKVNIAEVVGQYVQLRRAGRNFTARCPFHKERTPSFHVSPERGTYMCFGCGEKGDIFSFIEKMEGVDFKTALMQLAARAGVTLHGGFTKKKEDKEKDERLRDACEAAAAFFVSVLAKHTDVREYLRSRGATEETIAAWRLGYAPAVWEELSRHLVSLGFTQEELVEAGLVVRSQKRPGEIFDRFRGRVMFPIPDSSGKVIAFSGRFFEKVSGASEDGEPAKYVNSPETVLFKKSRTLYGLDRARAAIRKADCILLVEGQFDLILAHQSGLPFAVALSGTALTPEHLSLLSRLSKRLVLALDADQAGIRAGLKSAHMAIAAGFDVKIPSFPAGKDPADLARENPELLKAAVRTSKTAVEFFLEALRPVARDERTYKKAVEAQILPLVAALPSAIEQAHFTRLVAGRLGVPEAAVAQEVAKRPVLPMEAQGEDLAPEMPALPLSAPEKKAAMLLYHFAPGSEVRARLEELWGSERLGELEERSAPYAEMLRFAFDSEVGEHTTDVAIAADMLAEFERAAAKERFKSKFL